MFPSPSCAALAIFPDQNSQPDARIAVAMLTTRTKFKESETELVLNRANCNRRWRRGCAKLWCNDHPGSIRTLLITSALIITIAAGPWLALCRDGSAGCTTDDRANRRSAAAAYGATDDGPGRAPQDCTANWVLCRCILHRHGQRKRQKG